MTTYDKNQWLEQLERFPISLRTSVEKLLIPQVGYLAEAFYAKMLSDEDTRFFLTHEEVRNRLVFSMQDWLRQLFNTAHQQRAQQFFDTQNHVGRIHARINLPVHLVLRGASVLKTEIYELLRNDRNLEKHRLVGFFYCSWMMDQAMEMMSAAYSSSHDRNTKAQESYRLFSAVVNSEAEKEKQNKALLDWENEFLFGITIGDHLTNIIKIKDSDFGLWFTHKGMHIFETEKKETNLIAQSIEAIDHIVADQLVNSLPEQRIDLIKEVRRNIRIIRLNIDELFNKQSKLESGRDDLTKLLSRKFLPVILNKEIDYSIKNNKPFAILGIDVDYFKTINDSYGHEAGDTVLNQLGALLTQRSRAGDFVFRIGGEEFLVILVDIKNLENAVRVANQLREQIARESFITPKGSVNITCSIGVMIHDGHPNYMHMLNEVDEALYRAKRKGRNQVVVKEQQA